jgi:hypothetical protein
MASHCFLFVNSETFLQHKGRYISVISMSDKKEIQEPGLDPEEAKELELNEQPKPTRKISHPATPIPDNVEPSTNDKIKGRRTIK